MLTATSLRGWTRLAGVIALAGTASAGNVLVVGSGGSFTTIQAAVDAAVDGDVILVKPGSYDSFYIDGKGLDVVADAGAIVSISGAVRVFHVAAGQRVLLSGLDVVGLGGEPVYMGNGLTLQSCAGAVRVQDCTLVGADNKFEPISCQGWGDDSGWEGASVSECADVAFAGCTLVGGRGLQHKNALGCYKGVGGGEGGHGLFSGASTVAVYDSTSSAGNGGLGGWGGHGGDGLRAFYFYPSSVFVAGSTLQGGTGGIGIDGFAYGPGGNGGHGLFLSDDSHGTLMSVALLFGQGGISGMFADGAPGQPFSGPVPTMFTGPARTFSSPVPVRESTQVQLAFDGEPFDLALVLVGALDAHLPLAPFQGVLLAGAPNVLVLGSLGASGTTTFAAPLGPLPAGVPAARATLQGVVVSSSAEIVLAGSRVQVILDASF